MNNIIISSIAVASGVLVAVAAETSNSAESVAQSETVAAEAQPSAIPATAVQEVNKAVTSCQKPSAKSIVSKDINAFCKEQTPPIVIGEVTPTDAIYLKGVERVAANVKSPDFTRSRVMAFSKAYSRAVAAYVMDKCGKTVAEQYDEFFSDQSSDRLEPTKNFKSTVDRISDKMAQLAEAKLDEGLRKMGVQPQGSLTEKRSLAKNNLVKKSLSKAIGSSAGLLPVQTFEGWDDAGKYAIGCVIRGGIESEVIAECLRDKRRPMLVRPEAGLSVEEAMPTDEELVSQFGVRLFFDKNGVPALLSFGQWGSAYTGNDEDMAEDAMDHALKQAKAEADDQLTMFINSAISIENESNRGEIKEVNVLFDANGVPQEESIRGYIDRVRETSRQTGSDTMIGRSTVCEKVIQHHSGHKLAVVVRMWSFAKYDAMTRILQRATTPPATPKVQPTPTTPSGKRRGKMYNF